MRLTRQTCPHDVPLDQTCPACVELGKAALDLAAVEQAGYRRAERDILAMLAIQAPNRRLQTVRNCVAYGIKRGDHRPKKKRG